VYNKQILKEESKNKPLYSVKMVFEDHWQDFKEKYKDTLRGIEINEVEKMLSCKSEKRGGFMFYCKPCDRYEFMPFGCNSRLCSPCGKRYTDQWASMLADKLFPKIIHRHLVFGVPEMLWIYFKKDRKLFNVLMDVAYETIKEIFSKMKNNDLMPGAINVYHPFGRDIKHQPHNHMIVTEGGFEKNGNFVSIGKYINYDNLHKKWEYKILEALKKHIPANVVDEAYRRYPNGFCAYVRKDRIKSHKDLSKYIGRYVRHPAIANSRIIAYNKEAVRFYWKDHDGNIHYKIMLVYDFMLAIIQHVPEKNQKLIRCYGAYSRRKIGIINNIQSGIRKSISSKIRNNRIAYCSLCKERMEFAGYVKKPPDKNMSKIGNWVIEVS
jgi:hypothetical protein